MVWLCGFVKTCSPVTFGVVMKMLVFTITLHFCSLQCLPRLSLLDSLAWNPLPRGLGAGLLWGCLCLRSTDPAPQTSWIVTHAGLLLTYQMATMDHSVLRFPTAGSSLAFRFYTRLLMQRGGEHASEQTPINDKHFENCLLTKQRPIKPFTHYPMKRENSCLPRHGPVMCH